MNGNIIITRPVKIPGLLHYGILFEEDGVWYVLHNTPFRGAVADRLDDFLKSRRKVSIKPSRLSGRSTQEILYRFESCPHQYHLLNYNCEHFIDCMLSQPYQSPQLVRALVISGILGFSLLT